MLVLREATAGPAHGMGTPAHSFLCTSDFWVQVFLLHCLQAQAQQQRQFALQTSQMLQESQLVPSLIQPASQPPQVIDLAGPQRMGPAGCLGSQDCKQAPAQTCSLHMCGDMLQESVPLHKPKLPQASMKQSMSG